MNENKKYIVSTKCGHVGNNKYIVIDFAVSAKSAKEAAGIARNIPRVKHHWKNAIEEVREVTPEEYYNQININKEAKPILIKTARKTKLFSILSLKKKRKLWSKFAKAYQMMR